MPGIPIREYFTRISGYVTCTFKETCPGNELWLLMSSAILQNAESIEESIVYYKTGQETGEERNCLGWFEKEPTTHSNFIAHDG